jgi:hypothetical protein
VPLTRAGKLSATLEAKNPSGPERVLQGIAEAWLRQWRGECPGPERETRAEGYNRLQAVGSNRNGRLGGSTEATLEMQERDAQ